MESCGRSGSNKLLLLELCWHFVSIQNFVLDMFENSFDDQYIGCTEEMEEMAPEILKKEQRESPEMNVGWNIGADLWTKEKPYLRNLPVGFKDEYGIALLTFIFFDFPTASIMNEEVSQFSRNPKAFRFYALHFYLTRAMTLLRPGCGGKPVTTYLNLPVRVKPPSEPQARVRIHQLGAFSTDSKYKAQNGSVQIVINTCFGVEPLDFLYYSTYKYVLVPVNEVFQVTSYNVKKIVLDSTYRKGSHYNCAYLGAGSFVAIAPCTCTQLDDGGNSLLESRLSVLLHRDSLESLEGLPTCYRDFADGFSTFQAETLPPNHLYDCPMKLMPGFSPP
ncbi:T-cell ecto-ADP-ribosyltransferase 1-like [Engystomops pustulosus]|uniref:T-cell ecto-ADP-ribosyltransferase 1-like n=1 Tax=Engystomops pustulosus TaxID=76066 RepID=UPI003AFB5B6C